MSVDPYMRGRMRDYESYLPPFQIGKVLEGMAVGEVVESKDPDFATGDTVMSMMGWREVFDAPAAALQKPEVKVSSPQMYLGVCGNTGQTAYIGLADVIKLQPGEVIFISGAAGAVGSIACQIAKLMGATVIASAGGVEKCAYYRKRLLRSRPAASMHISTMSEETTWMRLWHLRRRSHGLRSAE
jgi:NADPH-dependent curcumin reductase CurA